MSSATAWILGLVLQASQTADPSPTVGVVGQCDPREGPGLIWTAEARQETRDRVEAVCRSVGASKAVCAWLDASLVRESSGRPGVRHTRGRGEMGLGPLGLSVWWHRDKWPGSDEDPAFCSPEVSALVALEIAHRAVDRYEAHNLVTVQSIFAGRWRCFRDVETDGDKMCFATQTENVRLCAALGARDVDCYDRIEKKDLGRRVPRSQRRERAEALRDRFDAARSKR
jgi:hypothetical protein